jgi:hypothetical protein
MKARLIKSIYIGFVFIWCTIYLPIGSDLKPSSASKLEGQANVKDCFQMEKKIEPEPELINDSWTTDSGEIMGRELSDILWAYEMSGENIDKSISKFQIDASNSMEAAEQSYAYFYWLGTMARLVRRSDMCAEQFVIAIHDISSP